MANVPSMLLPLQIQALESNGSFIKDSTGRSIKSDFSYHKSLDPANQPIEETMNPFGDSGKRIRFYSAEPVMQQRVLLNLMKYAKDNNMNGFMDAIERVWHQQEIVTGGWKHKEHISQTGDDIAKAFNDIAGGSSGLPKGKLREREFNINQIGFGSLRGIDDKNMTNRELVKRVWGVDIGVVANVINRNDALRIGKLEMDFSGFNANKSFTGSSRITNSTNWLTRRYLELDYSTEISRKRDSFRQATIGGRIDEVMALIDGNATNAFQVDNVTVPQWVRDRVKQQNAFNNSGLNIALHGLQGFLSDPNAPRSTAKRAPFGRSASDKFRDMGFIQEGKIARGNAALFGIHADEDSILMWADTMSTLGRFPSEREIRRASSLRNTIARTFIGKVEGSLSSLGLDANLGRPTETLQWERVRNGRGYWVRERRPSLFDTRSITQQLQDDIGVGRNINIPSGQRLYEITKSFATNGMFSNFNNKAITGEAHNTLNITEQAITNIRFNSTRGDRELLNRMRYVELLQANSSGVSSI